MFYIDGSNKFQSSFKDKSLGAAWDINAVAFLSEGVS